MSNETDSKAEPMSFEERNALSGLATSLIAWAVMGSAMWRKYSAGQFDGPDGVMLWARSMLWLIAFGIAFGIILAIAFAIIDAIVHGKEKNHTQTDERDRLIALLGYRITLAAVSIGLVGAILGMAFGWTAVQGLMLIFVSCALGDTVGVAYKVFRYRRGF